MSGKWNNGQAYYLCRFPTEYALANRVSHPKNVYLKEADVLGQVDHWLAELFAPEQRRRDARPARRASDATREPRGSRLGRSSPGTDRRV